MTRIEIVRKLNAKERNNRNENGEERERRESDSNSLTVNDQGRERK